MAPMPINPEARLKAFTDIWMHQNGLFYSRLQTMLIAQIAGFGAGYTLRNLEYHAIVFFPFFLAILATAALLHFSHVDSAVRNKFEKRLVDEFNIRIRLDENDPDDQEAYSAIAWTNIRWPGSGVYMNLIFCGAMIIDALGALLLTIKT